MITKTHSEDHRGKTWKRHIRILMALILFSMIVFIGAVKPASAYTAPYKLMVFTDLFVV